MLFFLKFISSVCFYGDKKITLKTQIKQGLFKSLLSSIPILFPQAKNFFILRLTSIF